MSHRDGRPSCQTVDGTRLTFGYVTAHTQIMRRALASLKYLPAVLCGVLVVAWLALYIESTYAVYYPDVGILSSSGGDIRFDYMPGRGLPRGVQWLGPEMRPEFTVRRWLGQLHYSYYPSPTYPIWTVVFPFSLLVTLLLPPALLPFTRFRFPLWSYFAWTALIAAELAYYLG